MTSDVNVNVIYIDMQPELTNDLRGHDIGTSTSAIASLKFELPKPFARGLNATVLDTWLFQMNSIFKWRTISQSLSMQLEPG